MSNRLLFSGSVRAALPSVQQSSGLGSLWTDMRAIWVRYRSRQRIAMLDSHQLKDIGVSYAEAEAEANKSFWRG